MGRLNTTSPLGLMDPFFRYPVDHGLGTKLIRKGAHLFGQRPAKPPTKPFVVLCFDDVIASAAKTILNRPDWDFKVSLMVACGLFERHGPLGVYAHRDDLLALSHRGHEIGCHSHAHWGASRCDDEIFVQDVLKNGQMIKDIFGMRPRSFAWPFGDIMPGSKAHLGKQFGLLRGIAPGTLKEGSDLNHAPALLLTRDTALTPWLLRAKHHTEGLILFTHDVDDAPSPYGLRPDDLDRTIDQIKTLGLEILTLSQAAELLGGFEP